MILVDSNEPPEIVRLIQQAVPVVQSPLNNMHMSDFFFGNYEGKKFQFSRKQAGELVGNLDEAEDQLRDYYDKADVNYQIVEGIISPVKLFMKGSAIPISDHSMPGAISSRDLGAKLFCYQVSPQGFIERGHSFSGINQSVLYAWMHRLDMAGINTIYTMNYAETARMLTVLYKNEQKPPDEHQTLQRIIKPRIHLKEQEPFVKALVFLSAAYRLDVGEKKAHILADYFGDLISLIHADVDEIASLEGLGKISAKKILNALGRTV